MESGARKLIVGGVAAVALAVVATTVVVIEGLSFQLAENLCLREAPRAESVWELTETTHGTLIRARSGRFAGWYLAADDSVNSIEYPDVSALRFQRFGPRPKPGSHVRNLYLRETKASDCYWSVRASPQKGLHHIRATAGRYAGWYLDFLDEYTPDTGSNPRTAWNLALHKDAVEGAHWRLEETEGGSWIRATAGQYADWYLDYLEKANVIERKRRGDVPRRDSQTPPLLPSVD